MMRVAIVLAWLTAVGHAEPQPPCDGDACDINPVDPGPRPWILRDGCRDTSDVVGARQCRPFGDWSVDAAGPELVLEAGLGLRHVVGPTDTALARTTAPAGNLELATSAFRILGEDHGVYAGIELEAGDVLQRQDSYGDFLQSGGVLGLEVPFWHFELGAEVMFGARNLRTHLADDQPTGASVTSAVIEARIDAGVWLTPWLVLVADVGAGVLERSEWVATLGVAFHVRAFGGGR